MGIKTLYIEYYVPKQNGEVCEERHNEQLTALQRNLNSGAVDRIVIFTGEALELDAPGVAKLEVVRAGRMTFQAIFDYANSQSRPDDIHILANNDIELVSGFQQVDRWLSPDDFFCLSRYELNGRLSDHAHGSQDVWMWRGLNRIRHADYFMGVRGCDCHIIGDARRAHYQVSNPSLDLHILHHHGSELRSASYKRLQIPSPWFGIEPSRLGRVGEVCQYDVSGAPFIILDAGGRPSRQALRRDAAAIWNHPRG